MYSGWGDRNWRVSMGWRRHRGLFAQILSGLAHQRQPDIGVVGKEQGGFVRWKSWSLQCENFHLAPRKFMTTMRGEGSMRALPFFKQRRRTEVEKLICNCRCLWSSFLVRWPPTCVEIRSTGCLESRGRGAWVGVG